MTISKILVAHDFSDSASRALQLAAQFAGQVGAMIEVAYVYPDVRDGRTDALALDLPGVLAGHGERYFRFLEEELKRVVEQVTGSSAGVACHVVQGDPVERLEALAREHGADVICLGTTCKGAVQRVLLGSVSELVLRSASVPVLLVP